MSSPYYTKLTSVARLSYDDIDAEKVFRASGNAETGIAPYIQAVRDGIVEANR